MTAYDCPTAARRQNLIEKRPVIRNPSRCAKEEVQKTNHESQEDGARVRHRELGDMAAWADRITFEEIREKSGLSESEVTVLMRSQLKRSSFRAWRKRVSERATKHRRLFERRRQHLDVS